MSRLVRQNTAPLRCAYRDVQNGCPVVAFYHGAMGRTFPLSVSGIHSCRSPAWPGVASRTVRHRLPCNAHRLDGVSPSKNVHETYSL